MSSSDANCGERDGGERMKGIRRGSKQGNVRGGWRWRRWGDVRDVRVRFVKRAMGLRMAMSEAGACDPAGTKARARDQMGHRASRPLPRVAQTYGLWAGGPSSLRAGGPGGPGSLQIGLP